MAAEFFAFDPALERWPEPEPLNNTERQLLRDMAAPGLPLWKVLRQLVDYREGLKAALTDPEQDLEDAIIRRNFFKVQTAIGAINDLISRFEQAVKMENDDERA